MVATAALDPREILRAIGIEDPDSVSPVTGGMDTAIWRVGHRENLYALRVFRPEQAAGIARETAAMIAAAAAGIPCRAVSSRVSGTIDRSCCSAGRPDRRSPRR